MTQTATAVVTESPRRQLTESVTATVTATPTPNQTPTPTQSTAGESDAAPSWLWWLLGAVLLAVAVGVPLLVRSRRRRKWRAELAAAEQEVAWFARTLLPDLRSARTAEAIRGGWSVSEQRVAETEDRLTALIASSPDAEDRGRAVALRDGIRDARARIRTVIGSGTPDASAELDAAVADLETALAPRTPDAPEAVPPA